MKANIHFWPYLAQFFLEWEMFQEKVVEKIKTHIMSIPFLENYAVNEKMWKNIAQRDRPQMTTWRMRIVCWITKATPHHRQSLVRKVRTPRTAAFTSQSTHVTT